MRNSFGAVVVLALLTGYAAPAAAVSVDEPSRPQVSRAAPATKPACTIKGTRRDDVLVGTRRNDVLCGRGGDDVLRGGAGDDVLQGDGGRDTLVAGPGDDALQGGAGADRLRADGDTDHRDVLVCGGGKDQADADAEDRVKEGCETLNQPQKPNRAPSGADRTLTILEDGSYTFAEADFGFSDPTDSDSLLAVTLATVPAVGALELADVGVTAGQSITAAAIPDLTFTPAADTNGSPVATFTFAVQDDGGTSNGGIDTDPTPNTVTIDVTPVNDVPGFVKGADQEGVANQGDDGQPKSYTVDPWASAISAGAGEEGQSLSFEATNDNEGMFATQPAVSPGGVLTFTPDPDVVGTSTVTLRLSDDGGTSDGGEDTSEPQSFTITTVEPGPAVTSISPSPLVPGGTAILTGRAFAPTPAGNTVTIGGVAAPVTAATATSLTVTVPCVASDPSVAVQVTVAGTAFDVFSHPLLVPQRDLDVGEATIIDDASKVGCNEIVPSGGVARYVIAAYNTSTNPGSSSGIRFAGDVDAPVLPPLRLGSDTLSGPGPESWVDVVNAGSGEEQLGSSAHGDVHTELLRENRRQYEILREEFGTKGVQRPGVQRDTSAADMPLTRNFRVSNIFGANICNSYYVASATRVYAEGKLVIYEDDATPAAFKAANNPAMAGYYDKIGDQFNADMEPIIRNNFGDILRRDAVTDDNGVMVAVSTPRLNTTFPGVAGFVVSCDQFPNDDATPRAVGGPYTGPGINGASNFGEYFYLYQPELDATGYSGNTPDNWYRTVRSTFIHESKHVASMAARTANGAPLEMAWLEEGTARHSEELWARQSIYNVPWKGNTGYGTSSSPNSIYCDVRPGPGFPECQADPRRPSVNMFRHFSSMYTYLAQSNSALLSPFGPTAHDSGSFWYATSWSLVRYTIDRYGTSDAAFLTALTQSTSTGVTNLMQQSPVPVGELLGRWALALAVDDYPGLTGASLDVMMPTWNFRDIYAGLNRDGLSNLPYPSEPTSFTFGSFAPVDVPTLYGGGVKLFQLSGTQTDAQLLRLQGSGGGALPGTVRLAIVRVE